MHRINAFILFILLFLVSRGMGYSDADIKAEKKAAEKAVFAAGCFWSIEYMFENLEGVISAVSGYTGGTRDNPSYRDVSTGMTGHAEAVEVFYNPEIISYEELVRQFFNSHDSSVFYSRDDGYGSQYRSEIFYSTQDEKNKAEEIISILESRGYRVATQLTPVQVFWPAEEYHQDYYKKTGSEPYCEVYYGKL